MTATMGWLAVAGFIVILELFTGTFYLLMLAIGLLAGALCAFWGLSEPVQYIAAGVLAALSTLLLRHYRGRNGPRVDARADPNVLLDIGQSLHVAHWHNEAGARPKGRAMHRGAEWDVLLQEGVAHPGMFCIVAVDGASLVVVPARANA